MVQVNKATNNTKATNNAKATNAAQPSAVQVVATVLQAPNTKQGQGVNFGQAQAQAFSALALAGAYFKPAMGGHNATMLWVQSALVHPSNAQAPQGLVCLGALVASATNGSNWGYLLGARASQVWGANVASGKKPSANKSLGAWVNAQGVPSYYATGAQAQA